MRSAHVAPPILLAVLSLVVGRPQAADASLQTGSVVAHSTAWSDGHAGIELELTDGRRLRLAVEDGLVLIGDEELGTLAPNAALRSAWRSLVEEAAALTSHQVLVRIQQLEVTEADAAEAEALRALKSTVRELSAIQAGSAAASPGAVAQGDVRDGPVPAPAAPVQVQVDLGELLEGQHLYRKDLEIPAGDVIDGTVMMLRGDITVRGRIRGDIVALEGDVILAAGGVVEGDVQLLRGDLVREGGEVLGQVLLLDPRANRDPAPAPTIAVGIPEIPSRSSPTLAGEIASGVMSLLGAFVGLAFMGIGLMFFAPRQLEAVADTVWHSFGRSFLAGLFAQPLLLPLLALLVVGLTITIVGILVVPFALAAFAAALFLAVVGGYLAVARTVGEIYLRRRMAKGLRVGGWLTYRYLFYGLLGLLMIWVPPVLFGRIPIAGTFMTVIAVLLTWIVATAGFGATLVSRAGIRGTIVRRIDRALTDEHYWEPGALLAQSRARRPSAS